ncbi:uncharacterized protein LOC126967904 [Leptidea sinapis]|uniref:uncharacterized protein LOC126967904 n=1 Tax=Leptidea sinapis TaxID=189913 RepID=UPI002140E4C9|nr:uncharacterized protein LOC126967904 [Leptidea sinapis]
MHPKMHQKINGLKYENYKRKESQKPLLFSSNDVDILAAESSRARRIIQNKELNTFHGCRNKNDSNFDMTMRNNMLHTYPAFVRSLRWSPSVNSLSEASRSESFTCNCKQCTKVKCPKHKYHLTNFKENIMRFCDTGTMTPRVTDVCCGVSSSINPAYTSSISLSTDDIAVKDDYSYAHPISGSIFKNDSTGFLHNDKKCQMLVHQAVRSVQDHDSSSCAKVPRGKARICPSNIELGRIYTRRNYSRSDFFNTRLNDKEALSVPICKQQNAYRGYHDNCRKSQNYLNINDNTRQLEADAMKRFQCPKKQVRRDPCIKLPKKVLSSVKDIESYRGKGHKK